MLPLFDAPVLHAAERLPMETLARPALLVALQGISDEAAIWVCRSTDVALVTWLARVVLVVEQTRVHLGGREP